MRFLLVVTEADKATLHQEQPAEGVGFEIRLDTFGTKPDFAAMRKATKQPLLATYRTRPHCGEGDLESRASIGWEWRQEALAAGFDAIDVELDEPDVSQKLAAIRAAGARSILSHHEREPGRDLLSVLVQGKGFGADILKIIGTGSDLQDFQTQKMAYGAANGQLLVLFFMGQEFQASRYLSLTYGAPFTFAMPDHQLQVAPGVPSLSTLREIFGGVIPEPVRNLFAVVGSPVGHSQSPRFHTPRLCQKRPGSLLVALPAGLGELAQVLEVFPELKGMAVTKPLKEEAFALAGSFFAEGVCKLGAINTLVRTQTGWQGANTDYEAMRQLLSGHPQGTHVRVLGYGGLGKAVVQASLELGHRVDLCNRNPNRLATVPTGVTVMDWESRHQPGPEVLVQATSAGMAPRVDECPLEVIPSTVRTLVETIYNPLETKLMARARSQGIATMDGKTLFTRQAEIQNTYFQALL